MPFHTFATGEVLTAANVNTNLMNQAVISCTSGTRPSSPPNGMLVWETDTLQFSVYNGTNWVNLLPKSAEVITTETTTSTSFTDLTTPGPSVTVTTGTKALVSLGAYMLNSATPGQTEMGLAVSGASTITAATNAANGIFIAMIASGVNLPQLTCGSTFLLSGLTAGANTFKAQYEVSANTGEFLNRTIVVQALP